MSDASSSVHVEVLEWWKTSGLEMKWYGDAFDLTSENGRLVVLEWWENSGLELKWSDIAISYAMNYTSKNVTLKSLKGRKRADWS